MKIILPQFLALLSTGLLAGAFIYGLLNIVPTFYEVPPSVHLTYRTQLMTHNSVTMQSLMITSIIAPAWYAFTCRDSSAAAVLAFASALLALTSLLVTRFGNVPINQLVKIWSHGHPPDDWLSVLHKWNYYNKIRSLTALGCFMSFITATLFYHRS